MIQAYQGYFQEDGRFIADNLMVKIPINRRVIVNVLDDEAINTETTQTAVENEINKRLKMVQSITGIIPSDIDVDAIRAERIAKRGLLE